MDFYIAGADDARFYMIRRDDLNLMFTAGHHWRKKGFKMFNLPIPHHHLFLDSGAFQLFGRYNDFPFSPEQYVDFVNELNPDFFASMDYPCEEFMREKMGGLTVENCIDKTVENLVRLIDIPSSSRLIPVIQGWEPHHYLMCIDKMKSVGLIKDYMGVGTLCRRGKTSQILRVLKCIKKNIPQRCLLHGFGVKISLLKQQQTYALLTSCDSAAWVSKVAHGEICIFTGKKMLSVPYKDLNIDSWERLSISVDGYVKYVEYLIEKSEKQSCISAW